jgi:RNA polymerase sigma-70 factor, ECF subfamily
VTNSDGKEGEDTIASTNSAFAAGQTVDEVHSDLAARAARREAEAWSQLFERHFHAVYTFVRYRVRHTEEAEDLASHVFEVAYRRADSFDYRGVPIEGWLFGIARNLVRDHIKRAVRRGESLELDASAMPSEPDASATADKREDIRVAMQALTEDQQTVITLRFLLDRSVAETARVMNRSEDAVKTLQRRALAAMQRQMISTGYSLEGGA